LKGLYEGFPTHLRPWESCKYSWSYWPNEVCDRCTAEKDIWESKENLKNANELVEEFEKEYRRAEEAETRQQETKEDRKVFNRELLGKYMAKLLYGWGERKYE